MKGWIEKFLAPNLSRFREQAPRMALELATATLLIEVARADHVVEPQEMEAIRRLLLGQLSLCEEEIETLLQQAGEEADHLVSLQHVTRLMNEQMSQQEKQRVIEMMWQVVYADGEKHHYEEHLIRQVADLLYVPHRAFIQARLKAEQAQGGSSAGARRQS
jgi:uncharacterized tellurite resistance protein B-like protein